MTDSKKGILIVLVGPTGSGKTDVSVELARRFSAPVISTDSRQVFRSMAIGTAQPSAEQLAAAKHYFIADREISDEYNCGIFEKEALTLLDELFTQYSYVIAVGGSGLYINALCEGLDELPLANAELRATLEQRLREEGIVPLLDDLREVDPDYYETVDRNNPARVIRALEVCMVSGKPYSEQRAGAKAERGFKIIKIGIDMPREELYDRINRRVEIMMREGLEEEARVLYPFRQLNALQTVGYKELFDYFDGRISRDEAVEQIRKNSRNYAKRQMTWFRRDGSIRWFEKNNLDEIEIFIKNLQVN